MKKSLIAASLVGVLTSMSLAKADPEYTEDGNLVRPDPTEWVFVSSSATDTASEVEAAGAEAKSAGRFNIIHVDPNTWAHYKETGEFPEGAVFTMSFYSMNPHDQGRPRLWADEMTAMEVGVKDSTRFEGGWGFFRFNGEEQQAEVFPRERCLDCHLALGQTDHVFTQLYAIFNQQQK